MFAGAIDVPIYPTLTAPQVRYILKDSGARVLAIQNEEKFVQIREILGVSPVEHLVFFEKPPHAAGLVNESLNQISLAELEARGAALLETQPNLVDDLAHRSGPEDLATIIYTSGTTGEPRA